MSPDNRTVLVAHPSPDLYGADLQLLQSITAVLESGRRVVVALPSDGPLADRIRALGAEVSYVDFPVLRKASLRPTALLSLAWTALVALPRLRRLVVGVDAGLVYVNTVTLPWWLLAARLAGRPAICHVHEAENGLGRTIAKIMMAPLLLATKIIVISRAALRSMVEAHPGLARKARLVYNGVPGPSEPPEPSATSSTTRLLVVGRLSPRKAPHLVLEAAALLLARGHDVTVEVAGSTFDGYEWYEAQLRTRADQPDLRGRVTFTGYSSPIWPAMSRADIVVQPSAQEPFGNAVVEAMLARRPVVAAAAQGHLESLDAATGLLVAPDNVPALADAIRVLIDDPAFADGLARSARREAVQRFSTARYRSDIATLINEVAQVTTHPLTTHPQRLGGVR